MVRYCQEWEILCVMCELAQLPPGLGPVTVRLLSPHESHGPAFGNLLSSLTI